MDENTDTLGDSGRHRSAVSNAPLDFWNPLPNNHLADLADAQDFWVPKELQTGIAQVRRDTEPARVHTEFSHPIDFWAISPDLYIDAASAPPDWGVTIDLPWFDADLAENPYVLRLDPPSALSLAVRRGRWLSQLMDIPEPNRRRRFAGFFAELFHSFPARATYDAMIEMALTNIHPDAVLNGCQFKLNFLETPRLTYRRRPGFIYSASADPEGMLSWRRSVRMAEMCGGDPTDHIEDDWFKDWLDLRTGDPLYWSFLDFAEWRLKESQYGYLEYYPGSQSDGDQIISSLLGQNPQSRTGGLVVGQLDRIGVIYTESDTPKHPSRGARG